MQIAFSDRLNETLNQEFLGPFLENLSMASEVNKNLSAFQAKNTNLQVCFKEFLK